MKKTQNFRYQNFEAKFDPVPTPTPPFFYFSKIVVSSFDKAMCRPPKPMPIFVTALLSVGSQKRKKENREI